MNIGKVLVGALVLTAVIAGASLYYLQVHAFYEEVTPTGDDVQLVSLVSQEPEPILFEDFEAIDADSSPIRFRACFTTQMSHSLLSETYVSYDTPEPRNAPSWFDCFDADSIAAEIKDGTALTFLGAKNIAYGIDRIVAITEDGRGYIWHEPNACTENTFGGKQDDAECPERPQDAEGQN